jgi:ABC-type sulfate/molybdate transport systems ATPase subunit
MIRVSNLSHVFDHRGIAGLHGVSFDLPSGKVLGVMGPNGSGKSTLLNILAGKISPQRGTTSIDKKVSSFPEVLNFDPSQNVQRFLVGSVLKVMEEEKKIQLARDLADTFEFTFQLRQTIGQLSSGQQQKVFLASKLIDRPEILLLDEPFTHLDPFTRREILRGLFEYIRQQEISIVWVTHDLEDALRFSDQIMILNFGKIEQFSSPLDLIQKPKNLFVAQFAGYRNFFPVNFNAGFWESPWGKLTFSFPQEENALLVVPDSSWEINEMGVKFKVIKRTPYRQLIEYEIEYGNQKVYYSRSPVSPLLDEGSNLMLSPLLKECFLIPL